MLCPRAHITAATALLVLSGGASHAQTRAADLWSEWQAASTAMGQEMTAVVSQEGDSLVLSDFQTLSDADGVTTTGSIDRITLTEQGDGSVSVTVSQPYTIMLDFSDETGDVDTATILIGHEGLDITVSGPAGARSYAYSAEAIRIEEGEITAGGGRPAPMVDFEIVARDLEATYDLDGTDPATQRFASTGTTGVLSGRLDVRPPPGEAGRFKASFGMGEMSSSGDGTLGSLAAMQQSADTLPPGFELAADLAYGWSRFEMDFEDGSDSFDIAYSNQGGTFDFAMSDAAVSYAVTADTIATSLSGSEIPVPVEATAGSSELAFRVPLSAKAGPSEAALRIGYADLAVSDSLWSMIDPTGQVPRSPLTLLLDATAQVQVMIDLMSPEAMEMDQPPGELRSLTVSALELSFGDTSLLGDADVSFAPGQMPPMPTGEANLSLTGGNALLEQLQAAGVIDAQQAGMARGVVGMFARPGAGPDTFETTIEFLPGGGITANGVPLQ